ncbi:serum response factor-binding protein 1-like isoform X1 [Argonauta hians]
MATEDISKSKNKDKKKAKDDDNQFGEGTSLDKMSLNNKVVTMRRITKKSKSHVLAKLIRQLKQLLNKSKENTTNAEKNKKNSETLLKEINALKKVKPDMISRFVLGNTLTYAELSAKGFPTIESRILARFANEAKIQKSVAEFRENHADWKTLVAFLQTQTTGRQIKKTKNNKTKMEKKVNIRAKKALMSNFLEGKVIEIGNECGDEDTDDDDDENDDDNNSDDDNINGEKEAGKEMEDVSECVSSKLQNENISPTSEGKKSKKKMKQSKNIETTNSKQEDEEEETISMKLEGEDKKSKKKEKKKKDTKPNEKLHESLESKNNTDVAGSDPIRKQMVVRKINLDDVECDDIFDNNQTSGVSNLFLTDSSCDNPKSERDLFATGSHDEMETSIKAEVEGEGEDKDVSACSNHSMFMSLSDPMSAAPEPTRFPGEGGWKGARLGHSTYEGKGWGRGAGSFFRDRDSGPHRGRGAGFDRGGRGWRGGGDRGPSDNGGRGWGRGAGSSSFRDRDSGHYRDRGARFDHGGRGGRDWGLNSGRRGRGGRDGGSGYGQSERSDNGGNFHNKRDFQDRKPFRKDDSFVKNNSNNNSKGVSSSKVHPSWEASRKRKLEASNIQAFQGKKITFSDD